MTDNKTKILTFLIVMTLGLGNAQKSISVPWHGPVDSSVNDQLDLDYIDPQLRPIISITDCKSVFNTVQREGPLKLPSERRLALDVAAFRE